MASKPINKNDVFETYRSSYRVRFDWSATMKDNLRQWLSTFESSTNCPKTLVMSSLLSMTGSLCGPGTTVCSNGTFSTTLNTKTNKKVAVTGLYAVTKVNDSWAWLTRKNDNGNRSMHYCARCGRVKEICLHCLQETGDLRRYLSTRLPVYLSTCLSVYLSTRLHGYLLTCRPGYGSLLLKHLGSRQGESERALLCRMWQGKRDMSELSTGNRGFKETHVYLSTCLPIYPFTCRPVYLSTRLHVYLSTSLTVYCSLLLKHLSSRQGESERALLCKMWQGKRDMSELSTGNRGFKETYVYLSTCRPVYPSTYRPVYPSTCLPVDLSTRLHVYMSTCWLVYLSTCLHVDLSTRLHVDLSIRLHVYLSTCLPVDLSTVLYC